MNQDNNQNKAAEILAPFREEIDAIDIELIDLLARRYKIVKQVAHSKADHNIAVVQATRAESVKEKNAKMAAQKDLDPDFIRALYTLMIGHAHELEYDIVNAKR